jgi:hypothetical protein
MVRRTDPADRIASGTVPVHKRKAGKQLSNRLIALLAGACALALFAAGCGGGDDTSTTASLTKAQFIKKADGICESAEGKLNGEFESFAEKHNLSEKQPPNHKEAEEAATTILIPSIEGQVQDIRALGAPEGDEGQVDELLTAVEDALDTAREDPAEFIESEGEGEFAAANKKAREYGLKACGSES